VRTFQEVLTSLWPHGNTRVPGLVEGIAATAGDVLAKYKITDKNVLAHIMAQFSHECGAGRFMVESIAYTAQRATEVWPNRYASAADCYAKVDSWPGDPAFRIKLMDHTYGGRMGNRPYPAHDGSTYIGRGLAQCTGLHGYERAKRMTGLDVVSNPNLFLDPKHAFELGVADFVGCGCLPYAEKNDLRGVTRKLNGGYNGLRDRHKWLIAWQRALQDVEFPKPTKKPATATEKAGGAAAVVVAATTATVLAKDHIVAYADLWPYAAGVVGLALAAFVIYKVLRR
jgi:putative chitinase